MLSFENTSILLQNECKKPSKESVLFSEIVYLFLFWYVPLLQNIKYPTRQEPKSYYNYNFYIYKTFLKSPCLQKLIETTQNKKPRYLVVAKLPNCVLHGNLSNINKKKNLWTGANFFIKTKTNSTSLFFTKK